MRNFTYAKVVFDYGKCLGSGDCVKACPVDILELSENEKWCKAKDDKVENEETVKEFHQEVEEKEHQEPDRKIKFDLPDCIQCRVCEAACPEDAIKIEG